MKNSKSAKTFATPKEKVEDNKLLKLVKMEKSKPLNGKASKNKKFDESEVGFDDYFDEQNDIVDDMSDQMYPRTSNRVQAAIRVRPFVNTEVGFEECISFPSENQILISDFTKNIQK